jgi:hypothetical protein
MRPRQNFPFVSTNCEWHKSQHMWKGIWFLIVIVQYCLSWFLVRPIAVGDVKHMHIIAWSVCDACGVSASHIVDPPSESAPAATTVTVSVPAEELI